MTDFAVVDDGFDLAWARAKDFTTTSRERGYALWSAVNTVVDNKLSGCIVDCCTGKGGSAMLIALALIHRGTSREIVVFDMFSGETASESTEKNSKTDVSSKAETPFEQVRQAVESTGFDKRLLRLVKGDVCKTLAGTQTLDIALLRLGTTSDDSTRAGLERLYPRLVQGGVVILEDYGLGQGAHTAVDRYFETALKDGRSRPLLWVIDDAGRGAVKTESTGSTEIARYDYIPPGMTPPDLLDAFPHATIGNPWAVDWPYLRSSVPHLWRFDDRHKGYVTGNASVEEAACLYSFAKQFAGKRGLEIGTYYGWTAAHLLAAGLRLDCVDPAFANPAVNCDVRQALDKVSGSAGYTVWPLPSPQCIEDVRAAAPEPWSFAFIDGNHDGSAPYEDAVAVLPHLAADAMVCFHDLTSPHVEKGLDFFRDAGFQIRLINTMQIIGVAWRGNVTPPEHQADPNTPYPWPEHLQKYLSPE